MVVVAAEFALLKPQLFSNNMSSVALLELGLETLAHFELSVRLVLSLQVMHAQN